MAMICAGLLLAIMPTSYSAQSSSGARLYTNAFLHCGNGDIYDEGALGVKDGMITFVGRAVNAKPADYDETFDLEGKHLYPALIASNTTLGLNEISAVRASRDHSETGDMNPNVRALIAYETDSEVSATVKSNGILFAQVVPRGGRISGTSSILSLEGWNWEDAAYRIDEGLHLNWPRMYKYSGDEDDPKAFKANDSYEEELRELREFFEKAQAYAKRESPLARDLKLEAMKGVFSGAKRLYVHSDFVKEIREVSLFKSDYEIPKLSIVGAYDSWMAADLLRENNISVLLRRVNSLPRFAEDPVDAPFSLPAKLAEAGVDFCLELNGSMETMQNRNLAFNAGTAVAYGLSREKALEAITLAPAKIFGIDHLTGSLEKGKEANFLISKGDLLDIRQSEIEAMYYRGEKVELKNRQDLLRERYSKKLGIELR